jgi:hypothetical protein
MTRHTDLPDAGRITHTEIDEILDELRRAPVDVTGARDTPEQALANVLAALERLGLIVDSTTAT